MLLAALALAVGLANAPLDPAGAVVFPQDRARALYAQTAGASRRPIDGVWTPSRAQIDALEVRLPESLLAAVRAVAHDKRADVIAQNLMDLRRQYCGVIHDGKKRIYVNGFMLFPGDENVHWQASPYFAADGGVYIFHVEYDPDGNTFGTFEFNGDA